MQKLITICIAMFGMTFLANGQGADAAYAAKLRSLYKGTVSTIQPADLAHYLNGPKTPIILDTRSEREYAVSHIPTARFVDYKAFSKDDVKGLDHGRVVVVYCTVGYRSERIGEQLKKLGFKYVFNLYGGIFQWVNEGHEVVDATGKPTTKVHAYSEDWGQWLQKGEKIYQ